MGFFSYICSKSKKSIPAPEVRPTEVVAFLPNGETLQGIYDGYGRIGDADWIHDLQFNDKSPVKVLKVELLGCTTTSTPNRFLPKPQIVADMDVQAKVLIMGKEESVKTTASYVIDDIDEAASGGQNLFKSKLGFIERDIKFEQTEKLVRVILAEEYDPSTDSFDTIEPSASCPNQGYFYDEDYDLDLPVDEQGSSPRPR